MTKQQREAISKMWTIFDVGPEDPIHLRALGGKGVPGNWPPKNITFNARAYPLVADRQRAFEEAALDLNAKGYNIFTNLNRLDPAFPGDEYNNMAVSDRDIISRRYLLIDIDRVDTSEPATDEEIDEINRFAFDMEIELFLVRREEPISVFSGNGIHLYLPLEDLPNDADSKTLCQQMLVAFADRFNSATVKVDTSVYNAGRITKVPGTMARKGVETEERYYRMASVVS